MARQTDFSPGARGLAPVPAVLLALVVALAIGLADRFLDEVTGYDLTFSLFYLLPVGLATWYAGRRGGFIIALLCTFVWYRADIDGEAGAPHINALFPLWDSIIRFGLFAVYGWLLDGLRQRLAAAQQLGQTDPLTGTLNPRAFRERLEYNIDLMRRSGGGMTLVYFDLDDFKRVNDLYGHSAGDRLLRETGQALMADTRRSDSSARLGGDEFALILPGSDSRQAERLIRKIQQRLRASLGDHGERISCSIGAVTFPEPPPHAEAAIHAADGLMYEAKHRGKNTVAFGIYDAATGKVAVAGLGWTRA